nr:15229_t:CDS:10 [Entrophospora candida]
MLAYLQKRTKRPRKRYYQPVGIKDFLTECSNLKLNKLGVEVDWASLIQEYSLREQNKEEIYVNEEGNDKSQNELNNSDVNQIETQLKLLGIQCETTPRNNLITIGLIGHPNVGKSSFINSFMGKTVVSTSRTPVFPSLLSKQIQILCGLYPISQVQEPYSSIKYLAERIRLENILKIQPPETKNEYKWSAWDICEAFAIKRGFYSGKSARPDSYRAANAILRLVIDGRILLSFKPPGFSNQSHFESTSNNIRFHLARLSNLSTLKSSKIENNVVAVSRKQPTLYIPLKSRVEIHKNTETRGVQSKNDDNKLTNTKYNFNLTNKNQQIDSNDSNTNIIAAKTKQAFLIDPVLVTTTESINYENKIETLSSKKPKTQEWDDLDSEEMDDPMMVAEYANETMPIRDYMKGQTELNWKMRTILINWIIEIHYKFDLLPETLFLSVNILDRFLSESVVKMAKLQLAGITAVFIASKYEEMAAPSITNYLYMSDGGYAEEEILKAERYVLQLLNYKLCYPNPMHFLRRISKADQYDIRSRTLAKYLMEITLIDHNFVSCRPSMIAASSLYLARIMLNCGEWHSNLIHYSTFTEQEIIPYSDMILKYLAKDKNINYAFRKYSTSRFMRVSIFVRDWIAKHRHLEHQRL